MTQPRPDCVICENKPATQGKLCQHCLTRISHTLADIDQLWELSAQPAWKPTGSGQPSGDPAETEMPGSDDWVSWRLGESIASIETWVSNIAQDLALKLPQAWQPAGDDRLPGATLHDLIVWLRHNLPTIANTFDPITDLVDELNTIRRKGFQALRLFDTRMRVQCPTELEDEDRTCGRSMRINPNVLEDHVRCKACGHDWQVGRLLVRLSYHPNAVVDVQAAARATGLSERSLQRLARKYPDVRKNGMYSLKKIRKYRAKDFRKCA